MEPVLEIRRAQLGATHSEVVELREETAKLRASAGDVRGAAIELRSLLVDLGPGHPLAAELRAMLTRFTG
ncbi:hypothetical protein ACTG9Q_26845 [Actinokineospora sp. 24-640]